MQKPLQNFILKQKKHMQIQMPIKIINLFLHINRWLHMKMLEQERKLILKLWWVPKVLDYHLVFKENQLRPMVSGLRNIIKMFSCQG